MHTFATNKLSIEIRSGKKIFLLNYVLYMYLFHFVFIEMNDLTTKPTSNSDLSQAINDNTGVT
jgi:hypothetical protein